MDEQFTAEPVVVGVNGSGTSLHAVRWALREAFLRGAPVRLVHAAPYAHGSSAGERRARSILTLAHSVADRTGLGVPTSTGFSTAPLPEALVDAGATAQLLVLGMGGGSRFDDVLVQSAALDVCATATCPVAIVRGHRETRPDDAPVVLGVDDVAADATAVTVAFDDAQRHRSRLVVVHAGHADARATVAQAVTESLAPWRSRHPGIPVEVRVVDGAAAGHLLEAAVPARLLVVGTRSRGAAIRMVLGSTSRTVLRRSPCPVLVVRRDARLVTPTTTPGSPAPATRPAEQRWTVHVRERNEPW